MSGITFAVALVVAMLGALPTSADAQDVRQRISADSMRALLRCGTHGPTLQQRVASRAVQVALDAMRACPEGEDRIAEIWSDVTERDTLFLRMLINASSITKPKVADALLSVLGERSRSEALRMQVLGSLLSQRTGTLGDRIQVRTVARYYEIDAQGARRLVDSARNANFSSLSHGREPVSIDPALQLRILDLIARIAADPTESPDMRIAARDVHEVLAKLSR